MYFIVFYCILLYFIVFYIVFYCILLYFIVNKCFPNTNYEFYNRLTMSNFAYRVHNTNCGFLIKLTLSNFAYRVLNTNYVFLNRSTMSIFPLVYLIQIIPFLTSSQPGGGLSTPSLPPPDQGSGGSFLGVKSSKTIHCWPGIRNG